MHLQHEYRECTTSPIRPHPRVSSHVQRGPLGRHGVLVWAGLGRILYMLCHALVRQARASSDEFSDDYRAISTSLAWMSGLWCVERSTRLESSARHSRQRQRRSGQYPNYSYFYINKARSPRIATARRSSHSTHISDRSTPDVGLAARSDYTWHDDYVTLPSHISCIRAARGTWDHNLHL